LDAGARAHWYSLFQSSISSLLKAGYIQDKELHTTEMGTPQGGTISPLLANIALDQMETDLIEHLRGIKGWKKKIGVTTVSTITDKKTGKSYKHRKNLHVVLVRYADDFVVLHEDKEVIEESKRFIGKWLKERGLELSPEKTKIVHSTEGFDFLGHHIRHYENKRFCRKFCFQVKKFLLLVFFTKLGHRIALLGTNRPQVQAFALF